jgi:UDP-2,3-diacylglucosamine pyrophosphatase LpxH
VQQEIYKTISSKIEICLTHYEFDGVRIEHGHQYEIMHHFDTDNMFFEVNGRTILNYPFGSFFVAGFLTRLKLRRHYITQVVPFSKFLRWGLIFDFWFTLNQGLQAIWFFFKMRFISHPLRFARLSKTLHIFHELFNRPHFAKIAPGLIDQHKVQILVMGHNHQATHRHYRDGRQYVNTGTWTDVTSFDPGSLGRLSRPTYALIEYPEGVAPGQGTRPQISLRVWKGHHNVWEEFEP